MRPSINDEEYADKMDEYLGMSPEELEEQREAKELVNKGLKR